MKTVAKMADVKRSSINRQEKREFFGEQNSFSHMQRMQAPFSRGDEMKSDNVVHNAMVSLKKICFVT